MAVIEVEFPGNLAQAATVADLRALPSSFVVNGALYLVSGLGLYTYASASVALDNGISIIKPDDRTSLQAGRYLLSGTAILDASTQRGAGAKPRNVTDRLNDDVHASDFGFNAAGNTAAQDTAALQAVIAAGSGAGSPTKIIVPGGQTITPVVNQTITPKIRTIFEGGGIDSTEIKSTASLGWYLEGTVGSGQQDGIVFRDMTLIFSGSGVCIGDPDGDFGPGQMPAINNVRFERCRIVGPGEGVAGSVGLQFNKCFRAVIDQCEIVGFETGVKYTGSDICHIGNGTRIWQCGTPIVTETVSPPGDVLGGTLVIDGCDILNADVSFIKSSNIHLVVRDCLLEADGSSLLSGPALDIEHSYSTIFRGNRLQLPAANAPTLLRVRGDGSLFSFIDNANGGAPWGTVDWKSADGTKDGATWWYLNGGRRQKIMFAGNQNSIAPPFATIEPETPPNYPTLWSINPGTEGLQLTNYGANVRVVGGAFVLPYAAASGTQVTFADTRRPLTGNVTVYMYAKAVNSGLQPTIQRLNGAAFAGAVNPTLTTSYAWYTLFTNVAVTDLKLNVINDDAAPGGNLMVQQIVVVAA